jgi:hypothetical protein
LVPGNASGSEFKLLFIFRNQHRQLNYDSAMQNAPSKRACELTFEMKWTLVRSSKADRR